MSASEHHDGEGEQDVPLVGRKRGNARVEGDPQPIATACGAARPVPEIRLDSGCQLTDAQQVEVTSHQLERERETVDETAQPVGGQLVGCCHCKARIDESRAIRQECQCIVRWQWSDVDQRLVEHADALATGHQHPDLRAGREYPANLHGNLGAATLAAVEDHQAGRVTELLDHAVGCVERPRRRCNHIEHRGCDRLGRREVLHVDIPHRPVHLAGRIERQARLPGAGWPDEGDEARATPRLDEILPLLCPPDEPGCGARHPRPRCFAIGGCAGRRVERGILREHCLLHALQRGAGLHAELFDEQGTRLGVHIERLRLATRAVEREHQQLPAMLAIRLLGDELPCRGDEGIRGLDEQLGAEQELARPFDHLLEAARLDLRLGDVIELWEGTSSPELQRLAQHRNRAGRVARCDVTRDAEQPLELRRIRGRIEAVARLAPFRSRCRERGAAARAWRWCAAPLPALRPPRRRSRVRPMRPGVRPRAPARRGCVAAAVRRTRRRPLRPRLGADQGCTRAPPNPTCGYGASRGGRRGGGERTCARPTTALQEGHLGAATARPVPTGRVGQSLGCKVRISVSAAESDCRLATVIITLPNRAWSPVMLEYALSPRPAMSWPFTTESAACTLAA